MRSKSAKKLLQSIPIKPDELWFNQTLEKVQMLSGKQQKSKFNFLQMLFMKNKLRYFVAIPVVLLIALVSLTITQNIKNSVFEDANLNNSQKLSILKSIIENNDLEFVKKVSAGEVNAEIKTNLTGFVEARTWSKDECYSLSDKKLGRTQIIKNYWGEGAYYNLFEEKVGDATLNLSSIIYKKGNYKEYNYKGGEYAVVYEDNTTQYDFMSDTHYEAEAPTSVDDILAKYFGEDAKLLKTKENGKNYYVIKSESLYYTCDSLGTTKPLITLYYINQDTLILEKINSFVEAVKNENLVTSQEYKRINSKLSDEELKNLFFLENHGLIVKQVPSLTSEVYIKSEDYKNADLDFFKKNNINVLIASADFKNYMIYSPVARLKLRKDRGLITPEYLLDKNFYSETIWGEREYQRNLDSSEFPNLALGQPTLIDKSAYMLDFKDKNDRQYSMYVYDKSITTKIGIEAAHDKGKEYLKSQKQITLQIDGKVKDAELKYYLYKRDSKYPLSDINGNFVGSSADFESINIFFENDKYYFLVESYNYDLSDENKFEENLEFKTISNNSDELNNLIAP